MAHDVVGTSWRRPPTARRHERRWHAGRRRLLEAAMRGVQLPDGGLVVDVAAGDGEYAALVAELAGRPLVISDFARDGVLAAVAAGRSGVRADARALPFRDASASLTLGMEFLSYLTRDQVDHALAEMRRITRPGGAVLLSTPNRYSLESWKGLARYLVNGAVWDAGGPGHRVLYSARAFRALLGRHFTIERQLGYYLVPAVADRASPWTYIVTGNPLLIPFCHKLCIIARRPASSD